MMKFSVVFLVVLVVLLSSVGESKRHGRRRHKKAQKDVSEAEDWRWPSSKEWKDLLDKLMGRFGNHRYGFGLGSDKDKRFNFDFGWNVPNKQWWEGPNVCTTKTEESSNTTRMDLGSIMRHLSYHSQVCDETESAYKCTTTSRTMGKQRIITEVKECCHGFTRKENEYGCPRKLNLENLVKTARKLGLTEFLRATDRKSLTEELKQGNFTVFAPVNGAFKDIGDMLPEIKQIMPQDGVVMVSKRLSNLVLSDLQNLLLGHLAVGQFRSSSLSDEQLIETGSPYKSKIRINFYEGPQKLMTANCVKVTSPDNVATNGVIHEVASLLQPVTGSLVDLISKSPQHGILKTALARANLVQTFREEGQLTLFAPTDTAFKRLPAGLLDRLLEGDQECLQKVLQNHVLPNVICSEVIQGQAKSKNLLHTYLNLSRSDDNKLFVEGAQIVHKDSMATNGVIHVIDQVLIPEEALQVTDIIERHGATEFLGILKKAKMLTEFGKSSNMTVFVPSNEAIQNLQTETREKLKSDVSYLVDVMKFHVVPQQFSLDNVYNNLQLDTHLAEKKIRINEYSLFPYGDKWTRTVMCAPIKTANIKSCNGMINIIDKVMIPPPGNVVDILALDNRFSQFIELIKKAGIADSLQEEGPFTIFAPTNQAFKALGKEVMNEIAQTPEDLRSVLENHIAKDALCCKGIFESGWYGSPRLRTQSGKVFRLDRNGDRVSIGDAGVTECDVTGSNGVVHVIDRVLVEKDTSDIWSSLFGRRGRWRGRGGHGFGRMPIFRL